MGCHGNQAESYSYIVVFRFRSNLLLPPHESYRERPKRRLTSSSLWYSPVQLLFLVSGEYICYFLQVVVFVE